jgi:hypothetical protein
MHVNQRLQNTAERLGQCAHGIEIQQPASRTRKTIPPTIHSGSASEVPPVRAQQGKQRFSLRCVDSVERFGIVSLVPAAGHVTIEGQPISRLQAKGSEQGVDGQDRCPCPAQEGWRFLQDINDQCTVEAEDFLDGHEGLGAPVAITLHAVGGGQDLGRRELALHGLEASANLVTGQTKAQPEMRTPRPGSLPWPRTIRIADKEPALGQAAVAKAGHARSDGGGEQMVLLLRRAVAIELTPPRSTAQSESQAQRGSSVTSPLHIGGVERSRHLGGLVSSEHLGGLDSPEQIGGVLRSLHFGGLVSSGAGSMGCMAGRVCSTIVTSKSSGSSAQRPAGASARVLSIRPVCPGMGTSEVWLIDGP